MATKAKDAAAPVNDNAAATSSSRRRATDPRPEAKPQSNVANMESLDRTLRALQARFTNGVSPTSVSSAITDWAVHMMRAPGRQMALSQEAARSAMQVWLYSLKAAAGQQQEKIAAPQAGAAGRSR